MSPLQLTFVPPEYWVKSEDYFQFVVEGAKGIQYSGRNPKIPKDVGFFVIWQDGSKKEKQSNILETEKKIAISFPKVPAKKLLSCKIKLAFCEGTVVDTNSNKVRVKSIYGKIIPIPPMSQLLFGLKLLRNEDRRKSATVYSDSVKTWAFLTKFSVELLSRGCFVPELAPSPVTYQETHQETQISYYKVYERLMGAWRTTLRSLNDWDRFNSIVQNSPWIAYNLPINLKN